jgi:hypothetical protein
VTAKVTEKLTAKAPYGGKEVFSLQSIYKGTTGAGFGARQLREESGEENPHNEGTGAQVISMVRTTLNG